ncbi:hypothetical protein TREMEDRAFT_66430 [Tremella mesenterica DSM 1558]|uniref:uncharacterized protein n=1 Tax=Tremella mesenterica (strain ATCC 24925 / CBS 8224 / DSM 1558 / NBRC 9311 / NRRL Y-6157 / RJB 2259-6 / UBC 559-6) TaxID=578456 RepID=UPI00032D5FBA|nr:uncharacterized protein TREMEDRAFT_66430 [Tremella mesenterica DSM 1558]EIW65599.1 hypothetical protein TREMEDRAFT_66430 [Tremella mesenterica DSM 1558]
MSASQAIEIDDTSSDEEHQFSLPLSLPPLKLEHSESIVLIPETQQTRSPDPSSTPLREIREDSSHSDLPVPLSAQSDPVDSENLSQDDEELTLFDEDEFGPHERLSNLVHKSLRLPPQPDVNTARDKLFNIAKDKGFALVTSSSNQKLQ